LGRIPVSSTVKYGNLLRKRTVYVPTLLGWLLIFAAFAAPICWWLVDGESYLCQTDRLKPDILVVEGWIGADAIEASAAEFTGGHYRLVVTSSGLTDTSWDRHQYSYAQVAAGLLLRAGVPARKILVASPVETPNRRTFESAVAVRDALASRGIVPETINVFTFGAHARRSRLVYEKVFRGKAPVGVISWAPPGYYSSPMTGSSERSADFIKETAGYLYELLLGSGRFLQAAPAAAAPAAS
jgi:hypothetical protein